MTEAGEEIAGLIEQAMAQACAYQYAHKAIDKEGVEELWLDALTPVELPDDEIGSKQSDEPAQRIPAQKTKGFDIGVPDDVVEQVHG